MFLSLLMFQASKFSPQHVDGRIDTFLEWFLNEKLAKMPEDEFKVK